MTRVDGSPAVGEMSWHIDLCILQVTFSNLMALENMRFVSLMVVSQSIATLTRETIVSVSIYRGLIRTELISITKIVSRHDHEHRYES